VEEAFENAPLDDMAETEAERAMMAEARAMPEAWIGLAPVPWTPTEAREMG
jgi:hypothetical protein